jgi:hypothetical protein
VFLAGLDVHHVPHGDVPLFVLARNDAAPRRDQQNLVFNARVALVHLALGNYPRAVDLIRRTIEATPSREARRIEASSRFTGTGAIRSKLLTRPRIGPAPSAEWPRARRARGKTGNVSEELCRLPG